MWEIYVKVSLSISVDEMEQLLVLSLVYVSIGQCFGQEELLYTINEQSPVNKYVGNIRKDSNLRATASAEEFSHITYSFLSEGNMYERYFSIDTGNGTMFTNAVIDREAIPICAYESMCVLSLTVVAKSQISAFFRSLKVTVNVLDINDHAPTFSKSETSIELSELATIGSSVALIGAEDADSGNNSLQTYFILNKTASLPFETSYERYVDGSSVVKLLITGDLDRETNDRYDLVIVAEDGGEPILTGTITVTISILDTNDNSPTFSEALYNITVNETTEVGAELLQLSAIDPDAGVNSEIVYSLSRNQVGKNHEMFAIGMTTGVLSLKGQLDGSGEFRVIVEASDKGIQPLLTQTIVIVNVIDSNNNPPEIKINLFSTSGLATVSEYAELGTVVAHLSLLDEDSGSDGVIACNIASDEDVFKLQRLDVNEYKVTVAKRLDRETLNYIYVVVNCHDKGSPPLNTFTEFTVQVIDENDNTPLFLQSVFFIDVYENNDVNTDLVQVSAIDDDINENGEITYSLRAPGIYQYHMDPMSGIIKLQSVFDREENSSITLYAYAKDNGSPARTSTSTIVISILDLNDNDPILSAPLYEYTVQENLPAGTEIGAVSASDADTGENARLGLYIDPSLPFRLDKSGKLITTEVLDREHRQLYNSSITVYDHGLPKRNNSATIVIQVTDVNDNDPLFVFPDAGNITVEFGADVVPSSVIATIKAVDVDSGSNGELFFKIVNNSVPDLIRIDSLNGQLSLIRSMALTDPSMYTFVLCVEDNGSPRRSSTTSLNLFVTRRPVTSNSTRNKGEHFLIAIMVGSITFVLIFTIVLVFCLLRRRPRAGKNDSNRPANKFYDREIPLTGRGSGVKFADVGLKQTYNVSFKTDVCEYKTSSSDANDSRDSDLTTSFVGIDVPMINGGNNNLNITPVKTGPFDMDSLPVLADTRHSTPRPSVQLSTSQSTRSLLTNVHKSTTIVPVFGHDDNHSLDDNNSQTSRETITSDSGRGGSESDVLTTSLSHSHDTEIGPEDSRTVRQPINSTFRSDVQPWMNLADLRHHNSHKLSVGKQVRKDDNLRLQIRNLGDRTGSRVTARSAYPVQRTPCMADHTVYERPTLVTFKDPCDTPVFLPPATHLHHSFMTYDDEEDDLSTTTSGSYTIDHHDVSLDARSPDTRASGLRGYLV